MFRPLLLQLFMLCFSTVAFSQCFDCGKNHGDHIDDYASDIAVTNDGFLYSYIDGSNDDYNLRKYDFNCNLVWSKNFGTNSFNPKKVYITHITVDELGNIYLIISYNGAQSDVPYNVYGTMLYSGQTLYKLGSNGNTIWYKKLGGNEYNSVDTNVKNLFYKQNKIFVVSSFGSQNNVNNEILLISNNYYTIPQTFLAVFDVEGNLIDAKTPGQTDEYFTASEMDNDGNIYLTNTYRSENEYRTKLECYDSNLELVWSKVISTASLNTPTFSNYIPTRIHYSSQTDKLYIWGTVIRNCDILGNIFVTEEFSNYGLTNSVLTEFNTLDGTLERFKHIKNIGQYDSDVQQNTAYIKERNGELYIFTNFTNFLEFSNATITSSTYIDGDGVTTLDTQEMVLFKVSLNTFEDEFIFRSYYGFYGWNRNDYVDKIVFHNDDLYMTGTIASKPLTINGTIINNNSGNGDSDAFLYKYNINNVNGGVIKVETSCLNAMTAFELIGTYNSISWNFGDPSSLNNTSNVSNPVHQFSAPGSYLVRATVTCNGSSEVVEKQINITIQPTVSPITTIYECETSPGSGISSGFDTSMIEQTLVNQQQNITVKYINSNGGILPSPLPNPYTNTTPGGDIVTARLYYTNNPECYIETNIFFSTIAKPSPPTIVGLVDFCKQNNATLNEITITGQNIKWYDALTNGSLLPNSTLLVNGTTYYVSQTINGCESERIAVTITVYETVAPTGIAVQTFCDTQVLTLADFVVSGTDLLFYDASVGGNLLPTSTTLVNGVTYYASQTLDGCESFVRLALTSEIISEVPANDFSAMVCDDLNNGSEKVDLSDYETNLIATASAYTFGYYTDFAAAESGNAGNSITNFSEYELHLGLNLIYVRVVYNNLCFKVVTLQLTLTPSPYLNMTDSYSICENGSVKITADTGFDSYTWSTGATSQAITATQAGNYWITVTDNNNGLICSSTKNITVELSNKANITAIETVDWTSNENVITVYVNGLGDYEYSIDGINFQSSNQFYGLPNGEYTVYVNDINGCGVAKKDVYLLMYPKFFTPNGDSYNDVWGIQFYKNELQMVVKIFDRYGKFIKQLSATDPFWDGTYNGQVLPSNDYWFTVIREDGTEYKGHFSLKR